MPELRTDIIDIYIFRRDAAGAIELLQLLRTGSSIQGWHPIMGHVEAGESAVACALRELNEEVGLARDHPQLLGMWSLEQVHPFFVPEWDAVVLSPRFAVEVPPEWTPVLNEEHVQSRWVPQRELDTAFLWPGQRACVREILEMLDGRSGLAEMLRIPIHDHSHHTLRERRSDS